MCGWLPDAELGTVHREFPSGARAHAAAGGGAARRQPGDLLALGSRPAGAGSGPATDDPAADRGDHRRAPPDAGRARAAFARTAAAGRRRPPDRGRIGGSARTAGHIRGRIRRGGAPGAPFRSGAAEPGAAAGGFGGSGRAPRRRPARRMVGCGRPPSGSAPALGPGAAGEWRGAVPGRAVTGPTRAVPPSGGAGPPAPGARAP